MTDESTTHAYPLSRDEQRRQLEQAIQGGLFGPTQRFYANAVGFAQSATDVSMVAIMNGQPVSVLTMSYVTAKSLVVDLSQILDKFEQATGQKIKTITELVSDLSKVSEEPTARIG